MDTLTAADMEWDREQREERERDERREAATRAFADKTHDYYHKFNGADAPCKRCESVR